MTLYILLTLISLSLIFHPFNSKKVHSLAVVKHSNATVAWKYWKEINSDVIVEFRYCADSKAPDTEWLGKKTKAE